MRMILSFQELPAPLMIVAVRVRETRQELTCPLGSAVSLVANPRLVITSYFSYRPCNCCNPDACRDAFHAKRETASLQPAMHTAALHALCVPVRELPTTQPLTVPTYRPCRAQTNQLCSRQTRASSPPPSPSADLARIRIRRTGPRDTIPMAEDSLTGPTNAAREATHLLTYFTLTLSMAARGETIIRGCKDLALAAYRIQ